MSGWGRYRKKPVVIEAMRLVGANAEFHSVYQWIEANYVTKTIKTILTDLENSLLKESSYISSPCREKTSWKDAFFDNPDLCPHCGRRQYVLETRQVDKGVVTYDISLCIFEDCEDHCVCHFNTNHL